MAAAGEHSFAFPCVIISDHHADTEFIAFFFSHADSNIPNTITHVSGCLE